MLACNDSDIPIPDSEICPEIAVVDGRLVFQKKETFLETVKELKKEEKLPAEDKLSVMLGDNFSIFRSNLKNAEAEEDTLVSDPQFAALLNQKNEIEVEGTVYRITPWGTFMYTPAKRSRVEEILLSINSEYNYPETEIDDYLYLLENSIYRFDTFKEMKDNTIEYVSENPIPPDNDNISISRQSLPPANSLKVYTIAPPHTIVGKFWRNTFGYDVDKTLEFSSKRRVKVTFECPNYVLFSYIRFAVKMQKKNWIGWTKTEADELSLGWDGITYKMKDPLGIPLQQQPSNPIPKKVDGQFNAPGSNKVYDVWEIAGYQVPITAKELQKAYKAAFDLLRSQIPHSERAKPLAIVPDPYTVILEAEDFSATRAEKIGKTLDWSVGVFTFRANSSGFSGINIKPITFEVKNASVFGAAYYGGRWLGFRIEKL